jgi:hypothetical protein|tara:strand:- start:64 stop:405 length:342 start_codon:yes stop_codon:yes gene_type:complete
MTIGSIRCVGKRDKKRREARMKLLKRCEGADLLVDTDFSSWTNKPAREWVCARVKEVQEGRHIDLMCYCETHDLDQSKYGRGWMHKMREQEVANCKAVKLSELILNFAISGNL